MNTKEKIIRFIKEKQTVSGKELAGFLGVSKQATAKHLQGLIQDSIIAKDGITRGATYSIASAQTKSKHRIKLTRTYNLAGLAEDMVHQELSSTLNLKRELNNEVLEIAQYAFTEILNNAIDHSNSDNCQVELNLDPYKFNFRIRDFGIGIFYSIFIKLNLHDENSAIGELIKGKTTTMKEKHTGEGVFFTSKAADKIFFKSHRITLTFDNLKNDVFVEEKKFIKGTEVVFSIGRRSRRKLENIFTNFAPEEFDYKFDRTRAMVKLFQQGYASRSEAKRLLFGLNKFKEIILDFKGVKSIGQGFADEIFRVFKNSHPDITIKTENLSPTLRPIIKHVMVD